MKRLLRERVGALVLASALGVTGMFGYERFVKPNEVYAAGEQDAGDEENTFKRITFAQGEGTGKEFSPNSWYFQGLYTNDASNPTGTTDIYANGVKPGIYANEYSDAKEPVLRLINSVRSQKDGAGNSTGLEAEKDDNLNPKDPNWDPESFELAEGKSIWNFRSGKATLNLEEDEDIEPIKLDEKQNFALKFTFSMPEAVVNVAQVGDDEQYAREYGGDGIAFVMTTVPGQNLTAGSGIGYGGMEHSFAIELDSFYNGAYVDNNPGVWGFQNSGFDNQAIFTNEGYNYKNEGHVERFDHVAITLNGEPKVHKAISYLNGIEPSWDNLAFESVNAQHGATAVPSTESTCATRFTDKNVDDRLFTVWVEYDGAHKMMYVSYANGDFKNAQRPQTPQISQSIDLATECFAGANEVYMGFTSAVATSKANHTIHAFQFTNAYEPITSDASYSVEYYLQNPDNPSEYTKDEAGALTVTETVKDGVTTKVQATDVVKDTEYAKKKYSGYAYATVDGKSVDEITVAADGSSVLKLYYNVADTAKYKVEYYKLDPNTEEYTKAATGTEQTGNVGDTIDLAAADSSYADKYTADHYVVNDEMDDDWSVELAEKDQTYVIKVYYDPAKTTYQTEHWLIKVDGTQEKKETVPGEETYIGKTVQAEVKTYAGYTHVTTDDSKESATVEADGSTVLKVYYEEVAADTAQYRVDYYKLNPDTEEYAKADTGTEQTGNVGDTITLEGVDSDYADKYTADHYIVNTILNTAWSVDLEEEGRTYVIRVYYDPAKTTYQTEHWLKKADGTLEKKETVPSEETYIGKTVQAEVKTYAGYTHVTTEDSKESATVEADGSTVLKVYYEEVVADTAKYRVDYYKLDPNTGEYTKVATGTEQTGNVGDTITLAGVDSSYAGKYTTDHYVVNDEMNDDWSVTLAEKDQTYVLKVYYDPAKTTYQTEYWVQKPDGTYEKKETVRSSEVYTGKTVNAVIKTYAGYTHVTTDYSKESGTVEAGGNTVLKVYYNADKASYKLEYYKLNPETKEYELAESSPVKEGVVGARYTIEDINSSYETKYAADNYIIDTEKTQKSVVLEEKDRTYTMKVYYAPKTTYRIEYWLQKPDGTYEKKEEVTDNEAYAGQLINALIKAYVGYSHTTTDESLETAVVTIDGTTVLKVYYKVEEPKEEPSTEGPSVKDPTEAPSTEEPSVEEPSEKPSEKETEDKTTEPPMTGDAMSYAWLMILLAAAVGGSLVIGKMKKE